MKEDKQLNDLKNIIESTDSGSVPINTTFKDNIYAAIERYKRDKGLSFPQDVIRLAVANFLSKAGYLS